MDIYNGKTAQEFVSAWQGHGERGRWMLKHAAEAQRSCAGLTPTHSPRTGEQHLAAAVVLDAAAERDLARRGPRRVVTRTTSEGPMILTERQQELLDEVDAMGPITVAALAERLGETESATRSALKRLEARRLVESSDYQRRACVWMVRDKEAA